MSTCHAEADTPQRKPDWLLRVCVTLVALLLLGHLAAPDGLPSWLTMATAGAAEMVFTMWWGVALGMVTIGLLGRVPREFVMHILGTGGGLKPVLRATSAGVLLDMCSHGILMVGTQLYERGASNGQVVAFLLASPWNSLSLTLILIAMLGLGWTVMFVVLSMLVGISTGLLFDFLTRRGQLPENPHRQAHDPDFDFRGEAKRAFQATRFDARWFGQVVWDGVKSSRMVVRWLLFGILLASAVRAFVPMDAFANWFGPTLLGLAATTLAATIIEVCSEGSTPLAVDIVERAGAPGNGFAFLMGGVATDYTEVMVLKEASGSWRLAFGLPLLALPQVLLLAWIINLAAG